MKGGGRFDPLTPPSPGGRGSRRSRGVIRLPAIWLAGAPSLPTEARSAGLEAFRLGPNPPSLAAEPRSLSRRAFCPAVRLWNLSGKARSLGRKAFRGRAQGFLLCAQAPESCGVLEPQADVQNRLVEVGGV